MCQDGKLKRKKPDEENENEKECEEPVPKKKNSEDGNPSTPEKEELQNTSPSGSKRRFSVKEFRKRIKSDSCLLALQEILTALQGNTQDCISEYLKCGGSCMEILQLLEQNNYISHTLVLEISYHIILTVISSCTQYAQSTKDALHYFLNTYMSLTNKMLSMSSSVKERIAILKFLTAVVAFSAAFAKEVLLNLKFYSENLELMCAFSKDVNSVRNAFVNFLLAYLVDGHYPTISCLLERKGLLTSIINGLLFDHAEVVCRVLTTLKSFILENPSVSKTTKMNVFHTGIIKDIVNLYNWKGPESYDGKNKRKNVEVDEKDKMKVNECVHEFLLTLCTSHKYGVIFRCKNLKTTANQLMLTVLNDVTRPWEHSYAGELVIKICGACPDVVKNVWHGLKHFVSPRPSQKWLKVIDFGNRILEAIIPSALENLLKELNPNQISNCIELLISPEGVVKGVTTYQDSENESVHTKYHVMKFLCTVLKSIRTHSISIKSWISEENYKQLQSKLEKYIASIFPNVEDIVKNLDGLKIIEPHEGFCSISFLDFYTVTFELMELYQDLSPTKLKELPNVTNLSRILKKLNRRMQVEDTTKLKVKIVKVFGCCDSSVFSPSGNVIEKVMPTLIQLYHIEKDENVRNLLHKIFMMSGAFKNSITEVDLWIDSMLHLEFDSIEDISSYLVTAMKEIHQVLSEKSQSDEKESSNKQTLSPLGPCFLDVVKRDGRNSNNCHSILNYIQYLYTTALHLPNVWTQVYELSTDEEYQGYFDVFVQSYIETWATGQKSKIRDGDNVFGELTNAVLKQIPFAKYLETNESKFDSPSLVRSQLLQAVIFYIIRTKNLGLFTDHNHKFFKEAIEYFLDTIENKTNLCDIILDRDDLFPDVFDLDELNNAKYSTTELFLVAISKLKSSCAPRLEQCLVSFKKEISAAICSCLKNLSSFNKKDNLYNALVTVGLEMPDYIRILKIILKIDFEMMRTLPENTDALFVYNVLVYTLDMLCKFGYIEKDCDLGKISEKLIFLNDQTQPQIDTSKLAKAYLDIIKLKSPTEINLATVDKLFNSIVKRQEYCKENTELAVYILENYNSVSHLASINDHVVAVAAKKGLVLPILDILIKKEYTDVKIYDSVLENLYKELEPSILKTLQKPHKANHYFEDYPQGIVKLIHLYMEKSVALTYFEKLHKFETTKAFHLKMLRSLYLKFSDLLEKQKCATNAALTVVHLGVNLLKKNIKEDSDWEDVETCTKIIYEFIISLEEIKIGSFEEVFANETFKTYCKYCLKFGISKSEILMRLLGAFVKLNSFKIEDASLLLDMAFSHSEFLDVTLNNEHICKDSLIEFIGILCSTWPKLLTRNHIPIFLASYNSTLKKSDLILYDLLKLCAEHHEQTSFYDFKPFLWGQSASIHYSVRSQVENVLWRQPRMTNVMDILQEDVVLNTAKNYPLTISFHNDDFKNTLLDEEAKMIYDLRFLYQVFNLLLAAENVVLTHKFTMSGALSLVITGLSCETEEIRATAMSILCRFYSHVEARIKGKDNLLWLTFVSTIQRGVAQLPDHKLNNFAAQFFSRMALILTRPQHTMYKQLSEYLVAKDELNLGCIPELYTLLHSSKIENKEHRMYILEILRDGIRTEKDIEAALKMKAFKFILQLYTSVISDFETRLIILHIIKRAAVIPLGSKTLLEMGILSYLYYISSEMNVGDSTLKREVKEIFDVLKSVRKNTESFNNLHIVNFLFKT